MNVERIRQQAQDENTAPETLAELAKSEDYLTRQGVAGNPNTPTKILLDLGAEFPRELFNNPIFDLLLIEDINFVNKIPLPTLRSILRQQDVPQYILEQACNRADLEVQLALANKINSSKKVLSKLSKSKYAEVAEAASLHIALMGEITDSFELKSQELIINSLSKDRNYKSTIDSWAVLIQIISIPTYIIRYLIQGNIYEGLFKKIAQSPAISSQTIDLLTQHSNKSIRGLLASNPRISINHICLLSDNLSNWILQKTVATNPTTPVDILEKLSDATHKAVRATVASNLNTPIETLNKLTQDPDSTTIKNALRSIAIKTDKYDDFLRKYGSSMYIRGSSNDESIYQIPRETLTKIIAKDPCFVAEYPKTPEYLLIKLSHHRRWDVRNRVAANKNTPVIILEELAADEMPDVRGSIARNARTSLRIIFKELVRDVKTKRIIVNQLCDCDFDPKINNLWIEEIKKKFHRKDIDSYKKTILENSLSIEDVRDILAEESTSSVETIVQRLINTNGLQAKIFLAKRADLPEHFLTQLAYQPDLNLKVKLALANNLHTSASSLEHLANTDNINLKRAIASHPNTPSHILEIFAEEKSQKVRALAMANRNLTLEAIEQILCGEYAAEYPQYNPDYPKKQPNSLGVVLNYYARSPFQLICYLALLQPQVSKEILESKSLSVSWRDRFAVAQNSTTPLKILNKLAIDSNQLVRAAAKDNLSQKKVRK